MATSVGTVWVDVRLNTANFGTDLSRALTGSAAAAGVSAGAAAGAALNRGLGDKLTTLGTSMGNLGRQLSLGLSFPLLAFGRVASQAFIGFEKGMTQTIALAGYSRKQVDAWRDDVLLLGEAYGVAGEDAAQALYFIASSGVEAADALGVLEVALKGQATGLGSAKVVADIVTSAMNSYGKANMSAAKAADILTVAVREGKGEADALAGALGRVIPLASSMGVSFEEVSGSLAALTQSGLSADEAATQINALLTALQKMPPQGQRAMKALTGLDYATVQSNLHTKGLVETLRELYNAFGDNEDAIGKVFGNVRALRGITGLFGEKEQQTLEIIAATNNALGAQAKAMEETARSPAFKLEQAMTEFRNSLVEIGAAVTPVLAGLTKLGAVMLSFTGIFGDAGTQSLVFVAAIAAMAGPTLYMAAAVTRLAGNMINLSKTLLVTRALDSFTASANVAGVAAGSLAAKLTQLAASAGPAGIAIAAAVIAAGVAIKKTVDYVNQYDEALDELGETESSRTKGLSSWDALQQRVTSSRVEVQRLRKEQERLIAEQYGGAGVPGALKAKAQIFNLPGLQDQARLSKEAEIYTKLGDEAAAWAAQIDEVSKATGKNRDVVTKFILSQAKNGTVYGSTTEAIQAFNAAVASGEIVIATEDNKAYANSFSALIAKAKETSDAFFGIETAAEAYANAQKKVKDANAAVGAAEEAHRDAIRATADAQRRAVAADQRVIDSTKALTAAKQRAADAQRELSEALRGPSEEEQLDVRSARLAVREAEEAMRGKPGETMTATERERASISLARARLDLRRAEGAHEKRVTDLRKDAASATDEVARAEQDRTEAVTAAADAHDAVTEARTKEAEAEAKIVDARAAVAQAEKDALDPAMKLTDAQEALAVMFATDTAESKAFIAYLEKLKELYPELTYLLDGYIAKFKQLEREALIKRLEAAGDQKAREHLEAAEAIDRAMAERFAKRQFGGPLARGQAAMVNERGAPELWSAEGRQYLIPTTGGRVIPLEKLNVPVHGGEGISIGDVYVQGVNQPVATAYEVRRQLRQRTRTKGRI